MLSDRYVSVASQIKQANQTGFCISSEGGWDKSDSPWTHGCLGPEERAGLLA